MNEVPAAALAVIYIKIKTRPGKQRKFSALKDIQLEQLLHITTRDFNTMETPHSVVPITYHLHLNIIYIYYSNYHNWTIVKLINFPSYLHRRNWEDLIYLGKRKSPRNQLRVAAEFSVP